MVQARTCLRFGGDRCQVGLFQRGDALSGLAVGIKTAGHCQGDAAEGVRVLVGLDLGPVRSQQRHGIGELLLRHQHGVLAEIAVEFSACTPLGAFLDHQLVVGHGTGVVLRFQREAGT